MKVGTASKAYTITATGNSSLGYSRAEMCGGKQTGFPRDCNETSRAGLNGLLKGSMVTRCRKNMPYVETELLLLSWTVKRLAVLQKYQVTDALLESQIKVCLGFDLPARSAFPFALP